MPNLMETIIAEYKTSEDLRSVKSLLQIWPMGAHSDYQGEKITGITLEPVWIWFMHLARITTFKFKV